MYLNRAFKGRQPSRVRGCRSEVVVERTVDIEGWLRQIVRLYVGIQFVYVGEKLLCELDNLGVHFARRNDMMCDEIRQTVDLKL
jgi:hypothetical protein